ncbi:MAG: TonB-dependent receptor domain-containing protein, partial [Ktedonobacteraceae bacterium]
MRLSLLLGAVALCGSFPAWAQFSLGTITGSVHDPSGAAIPGCKVTAVSLSGATTRTVATNAQGLYTVPSMPVGTYHVTAESSGFQKASAELTLGVDQTVTQDFNLTLGNVKQQVKVTATAGAVALQRSTHEVSNLVTTSQLEDLPAGGRSFLSLATLGTGAQSTQGCGCGPVAHFGSLGHAIILAGQFVGSTEFLQDGVVNTNLLTQTANIVSPIESIQEVSVESNGMSAKFQSPGVVNVITKSGTNTVHGSVFDYFQNDALNARNFFASSVPVTRYNQFGATLGGPLLKNKLFAFFDYAGQRDTTDHVSRNRVPTGAERQGNFQSSGVTVYDPATYNATTGAIAPFSNDVIPSNRFDQSAVHFLSYFPMPNRSLVNGIDYVTTLGDQSNYDQYLGRVDYVLSSSDSVMGSVEASNSPVLQPSIVNGLFGKVYKRSGKNGALREIHVFSPSLLNVARVGYNRSILILSQQGVGAEDYAAAFGLDNITLPKSESIPPEVSISGCCSLGQGANPQGGTQNLFQFADEVDLTTGRHQIFIGMEMDRLQFNGTWMLFNGGTYSFTGLYTGSSQQLGSSIADFLLGYPSQATGGLGLPSGAFRQTNVGAYFQDNWTVTPKLTLNLGMRYDYFQPTQGKWGKIGIIDLPTGTVHHGT